MIRTAGQTDVTVQVVVMDSSSTTGARLAGLVFNTASLTCYYSRAGATPAAITLATMTVAGAHADGGFVAVDGTNMPGVYRLDLPDAVCASGVEDVIVTLKGAANMSQVDLRIELKAFPLNNMTPNVGSVASLGAQAKLDVNAEADTALTDYDGIVPADLPANFAALGINGSGHVSRVVLTDTTTTNTDMRGTDNALLASGYTAPDNASVAAILLDTGTDGVVVAAGSKAGYSLTATTGLGNQTANITGSVASVVGAVGSVAGNVSGSVTGSIGSLATQAKADVNAEVADVIDTDTSAELSAPPAATSSLRARVAWLFALARNKVTATATTQTLRNDADNGNVGTASLADDDTTFTRGEWS